MRQSMALPALLLAIGCLLAPAPATAGVITSSFETDVEGWAATGIDFNFTIFPPAVTDVFLVSNDGDMAHEAAGGNPGGYARLTDLIEEPSSFAEAPASYTGDLSGFAGGTFSFDHRLFDRGVDDSGGPAAISPYAFLLISGDLFDLNALVWTAPAPPGNTDWVHFDIALDLMSMGGDLTFIQDVSVDALFPDFPLSGTVGSVLGRGASMSFEAILGDVTTVLLPFEISNNRGVQESEWAGVDNVMLSAGGTVPEPGVLALLLLGGGALLLRRHTV